MLIVIIIKNIYIYIVLAKETNGGGLLFKDLPYEFIEFIKYTQNLKFEENPNYILMKGYFKNILIRMNFNLDKLNFINIDQNNKNKIFLRNIILKKKNAYPKIIKCLAKYYFCRNRNPNNDSKKNIFINNTCNSISKSKVNINLKNSNNTNQIYQNYSTKNKVINNQNNKNNNLESKIINRKLKNIYNLYNKNTSINNKLTGNSFNIGGNTLNNIYTNNNNSININLRNNRILRNFEINNFNKKNFNNLTSDSNISRYLPKTMNNNNYSINRNAKYNFKQYNNISSDKSLNLINNKEKLHNNNKDSISFGKNNLKTFENQILVNSPIKHKKSIIINLKQNSDEYTSMKMNKRNLGKETKTTYMKNL